MSAAEQTNFFYKALAHRAFARQKSAQVMPYQSKKGALKIVESISRESHYGAVAIINKSTESIAEEFIFDSIKNMTLHGRKKGEKKFTVTCKPGETQAILLKRNDETAASFHFKSRLLKAPAESKGMANMLAVPKIPVRGFSPNSNAGSVNSAGS